MEILQQLPARVTVRIQGLNAEGSTKSGFEEAVQKMKLPVLIEY